MTELNIEDGAIWRAHTSAPLVLSLTDSEGRTGYGQAVSLPGRGGGGGLEAARTALVSLISQLPSWSPSVDTTMLPPSASMAWNTAVADLAAQAQNLSLARLLEPTAPESVVANGLVDPATDLEDVVAEGYTCVKVKVSRQPAEEVRRIARLRELLGPDGIIRLDANQGFDRDGALAFLRQVAGFDIQYIEEPTSRPTDWQHLTDETGIPIAADESLDSRTATARFVEGGWARWLVLKPALWSSPESVIEAAKDGRAAGYGVTITSARDGVLGTLLAAHVAAAVHSGPAGLGWGDVRPEELSWTDVDPGPRCVLPIGLGVNVDLRRQ